MNATTWRYVDPENGLTRTIPDDRMWHTTAFSLDGKTGISPISYGANVIGGAIAADKASAQTFTNGMNASGLVTMDAFPTPDQRNQVREHVRQVSSSGGVYVLEKGNHAEILAGLSMLGVAGTVENVDEIKRELSLFSGPSYRDELSALPSATKQAIDSSVSGMFSSVKGFADVLGLNAKAIDGYTKDIPITDAILTSSTVQEPDAGETLWTSAPAYAIDDVRIRPNHRKYRCVKAIPANTNVPPENDAFLAGEAVTAAKSWQHIGATNRRAMFELERNTTTTSTGTMTVVLTPGQRVGALFLGGMQATKVTVVVTLAGQEIYRRAVSRIARRTTSWKTYFFGKFIVLPSLLLADLPPSTGAVITVTLENSFGSAVKCAALVIGNGEFIGNVQKKAKSDALNFSVIERDKFGNATLLPRRTVPRADMVLETPKGLINTVRDLRVSLNGRVAVWSGLDDISDDGYFESLLFLGPYRQFSIDLDQPKDALVTLEVEEF